MTDIFTQFYIINNTKIDYTQVFKIAPFRIFLLKINFWFLRLSIVYNVHSSNSFLKAEFTITLILAGEGGPKSFLTDIKLSLL